MIHWKLTVGVLILLALFSGMFYATYLDKGLQEALYIWAVAIGTTAVVVLAAFLIASDLVDY